jgi:peptidoglycan hydrolase-like protein with peptidoglycan-binding domain
MVDLPAPFESLSPQMKASDASTEWRSIRCEANATAARTRGIQRALATAGFELGPIDGVILEQALHAVNAYPSAKGVPVDAYLNPQTVTALGVKPN